MGVKLHFISNNVKGLQNFLKMIKIFEYLKSNLCSNGFLLLGETRSSFAAKKKWVHEFKGPTFFSHGESNSWGVAIEYMANDKIDVF